MYLKNPYYVVVANLGCVDKNISIPSSIALTECLQNPKSYCLIIISLSVKNALLVYWLQGAKPDVLQDHVLPALTSLADITSKYLRELEFQATSHPIGNRCAFVPAGIGRCLVYAIENEPGVIY